MSRKKYHDNEKSLGGRLRKFRKSRYKKTPVFLKLLNISQASLSDYENNKTIISGDAIIKLKQNTDISIDWLLTGEGKMVSEGTECDICIYKVGDFEHRVAEKKIEYDPKISELLKMTRIVLESGTEYSDSLAANIRSFFHSVQMEKRLLDVESRLSVFENKIKKCPADSEGSILKKKM